MYNSEHIGSVNRIAKTTMLRTVRSQLIPQQPAPIHCPTTVISHLMYPPSPTYRNPSLSVYYMPHPIPNDRIESLLTLN